MKYYLNISCSPLEEECKQVGKDTFESIKEEVLEFLSFLKSYCKNSGVPEDLIGNLKVKTFLHDYGYYCAVVCFYDDENRREADFALWLESNIPEKWTDKKASKQYVEDETQGDIEQTEEKEI